MKSCKEKRCPDAHNMGEFACENKSQCWEPCGTLGKAEKFARPVDQKAVERIQKVTNRREYV